VDVARSQKWSGMESVGDNICDTAAGRLFNSRERPRGGCLAILIFSRAFVLGYVK
jgi:hypothetical protein